MIHNADALETALAYAGLREQDRTQAHREQMRRLLELYQPGDAVMIFKDSPPCQPQATQKTLCPQYRNPWNTRPLIR
jgi:hypothetical protein